MWIYTTTHAHVLLRIQSLRAAGKRLHIEDDEGRLSKSGVTVDNMKGMAIGLKLKVGSFVSTLFRHMALQSQEISPIMAMI